MTKKIKIIIATVCTLIVGMIVLSQIDSVRFNWSEGLEASYAVAQTEACKNQGEYTGGLNYCAVISGGGNSRYFGLWIPSRDIRWVVYTLELH